MNRFDRSSGASRPSSLPLAGALFILTLALASPAAFAVEGDCLGGLGCTAGDFTQISLATTIVGGDDCVDGKIDLQFDWSVTRKAGVSRYDIGFWVPVDGLDASGNGTCVKNAYLGAPVADSWSADDADACLDILGLETGLFTQFGTIECVDLQAPFGVLDDPFVCLSWDNQSDDANCNADDDIAASTPSKCQCVFADASAVTFPGCGNNVVDRGEECDDGNIVSGDGCSSLCQTEECGDGVQQSNEQCDDGNIVSGDGCSSLCQTEECGDGVQQSNEQCDDGNAVDGDGCSANCTIEVPTVGEWGLGLLSLLLLGAGALAVRKGNLV